MHSFLWSKMQGEKRSIGSVLKRKYWVIYYFKGPYLVWSFSNLLVPNEEVFTVLQDIKNSFPYTNMTVFNLTYFSPPAKGCPQEGKCGKSLTAKNYPGMGIKVEEVLVNLQIQKCNTGHL